MSESWRWTTHLSAALQQHFSMSGKGFWLNHSVFQPLSKAHFEPCPEPKALFLATATVWKPPLGVVGPCCLPGDDMGKLFTGWLCPPGPLGCMAHVSGAGDRCCIHVLERRGCKEERENTYPHGVWGIWTNTLHGHAKVGKGLRGGAGGAGGEGFQGDGSERPPPGLLRDRQVLDYRQPCEGDAGGLLWWCGGDGWSVKDHNTVLEWVETLSRASSKWNVREKETGGNQLDLDILRVRAVDVTPVNADVKWYPRLNVLRWLRQLWKWFKVIGSTCCHWKMKDHYSVDWRLFWHHR